MCLLGETGRILRIAAVLRLRSKLQLMRKHLANPLVVLSLLEIF